MTAVNSMANILLVDDDRLVLATLKQGLSKVGYTVTAYDNGQDALEFYRSSPPDLVVLDLRMPGLSGLVTARAMLESAYRPILMLSACDDQAIVREAVTTGVAGYLVKPIEANQMAPSIEVALARFAEVNALLKNKENLCDDIEKNLTFFADNIVFEIYEDALEQAGDLERSAEMYYRVGDYAKAGDVFELLGTNSPWPAPRRYRGR